MPSKTTKGDTGVSAPSKRKNLILRTISYLILAPACLLLIWMGGKYLHTLILLGFCVVFYEWFKLVVDSPYSMLTKLLWFFAGLTYTAVAFRTFWNYALEPGGNLMLMSLIGLVWASDTGGYIFGITIKGPKLAPLISPNKTWSGFAGALILTTLIAHIIFTFTVHFDLSDVFKSAMIAIPLSILVQLGDLIESWTKRRFNVKDTGNIIPGHGGLIDRIDGLIAVGFAIGVAKAFNVNLIQMALGS